MFDIPFPEKFQAAEFLLNPLVVRLTKAELSRRNIDADTLWLGLGFCPSDLEDPDYRISYLQASKAIRLALDAAQDPNFGLCIGMRLHIASWGLVGLGKMAASTLRASILFAVDFHLEAGSMLQIGLESDQRDVVIVAAPRFADVTIEPALVDGTFGAMVSGARELVGATFKPLALELVAARPANMDLHHQHFGCPIRFGCAGNRMIYDKAWVLNDLQTADPLALQHVESSLRVSASRHSKSVFYDSLIDAHLRSNLRVPSTPHQLATLLHMSDRNLRRKLTEVGLSYVEILDRVRKTKVLQLIAHTQFSLGEITEEVGFSDPRSLTRAFKRWMGESISDAMVRVRNRTDAQRNDRSNEQTSSAHH